MSKLRTNSLENLAGTSSVAVEQIERKREAYVSLGEYATITNPINYDNSFTRENLTYRLRTNVPAPYISTGVWEDEVDNFIQMEFSLFQELSQEGGSFLVGHVRTPLAAAIGSVGTVGFALSSLAVTPWEYESLIVSKPDPDSPATWDWYPAIQAMLDGLQNGQCISLVGGMTYRVSAPLVVPPSLTGCVFLGNGATIKADHNGDGLVMIATNENFSRHKVYDLNVMGPNVSYPNNATELAGTSTGAGLKMGRDNTTLTASGYLTSFHNCSFTNFHKGVYLQNVLLCHFYGGYIAFNQYGIYFDAGQTNANRFFGVSIRENRLVGVYSSGRTGGALTKATNNVFYGCEIETNIPYNLAAGGYPTTFDDTGVGVGVMLLDSYDFLFDGCYSENQNYGVWLGSSADDNKFINCRLAQGGAGGFRSDGVMIAGPAVDNNIFRDCKISNGTSTVGNVTISSVAGTANNKFLDCVGFVFEASKLAVQPYIQNNTKSQGSVNGTSFGALVTPPQGIIQNPIGGTLPGQIDGIGTATASLNAYGIGEATLGSQITAATTITAINNMRPGQFLVLSNYQIANAVTVKASVDGTSGIVLRNREDAVLAAYGDSITLYCMAAGTGRVVEVGRSIRGLGGIAFTTATRNALTGVRPGTSIFDTTLGKPIWRNGAGTAWVDATGATV